MASSFFKNRIVHMLYHMTIWVFGSAAHYHKMVHKGSILCT